MTARRRVTLSRLQGTGPAHQDSGMSIYDLGYPQIIALLILLQRGLEELHSQRNTRLLIQRGGREAGAEYYPVVAVSHVAWIASIAFLIPANAPVYPAPLAAFLLLQPVRYWVIGTLGPYWTHRIITVSEAPIVTKGPYRYVRHPNYAVTLAETLLLPIAFGQLALGVIFATLWGAVLLYKVRLEDDALAVRRANVSMTERGR
jgi:methyltransferase